MGDTGDDGDKASPTSSHDVKPPTIPKTSGEEAAHGSRRGSEQRHKRLIEANMDHASKNGSAAPSEARYADHTSTAQSHPMTTSTSTSSHLSNKDSPPPQTGYGTRSRNRPGAPRPNYAEDVEMDFEMAPQANGR